MNIPTDHNGITGKIAYKGRFAPSPTGPLHFGSLVAAMGSYLQARSQNGQWLVRMEDLDPPREVPGAADDILRTLEVFGFQWDGPVVYQSQRSGLYGAALDELRVLGALYGCACTRREVADSSLRAPDGSQVYPGTCRNGIAPGRTPRALRVRTDAGLVTFRDRIQGEVSQDVASEVGDFVLRRADGLTAYQLAVVVDDGAQGMTEVVRGADLLDSTPRQIFLQRLLAVPTPTYAHLPAAVNDTGEKLSKQTLAPPLDRARPLPVLLAAWRFLGQDAPADAGFDRVEDFWTWAAAHWSLGRVPRARTLAVASVQAE